MGFMNDDLRRGLENYGKKLNGQTISYKGSTIEIVEKFKTPNGKSHYTFKIDGEIYSGRVDESQEQAIREAKKIIDANIALL